VNPNDTFQGRDAHNDLTTAGDLPAGLVPVFGMWEGAYSSIILPSAAVVRTPAEWEELWNRVHAGEEPLPTVPVVDFSQWMILAVFQGAQPTGGYRIGIEDVRSNSFGILVDVAEQQPGTDELTTQAISSPYFMVMIEQSDLPVYFLGIRSIPPEPPKTAEPDGF
jgi:hypothetical protein